MDRRIPREGDVHEIAFVGGHSFTIRYGYYTEEDRKHTDPIPIYPCFIQNPHYTAEGHPLVTRIQDACEHYQPEDQQEGEGWCADCTHCTHQGGQIGVCKSPQRISTIHYEESTLGGNKL